MASQDEKKPPVGGWSEALWSEWLGACVDAGLLADAALHDRVLDEVTEVFVVSVADVHQIDAAAAVAPKPSGVVVLKAAQLVFQCLRSFALYLKARLKFRLVCFKMFYLRGYEGEVLAERRRAAAFVDQRHQAIKKRFKHKWLLSFSVLGFVLRARLGGPLRPRGRPS